MTMRLTPQQEAIVEHGFEPYFTDWWNVPETHRQTVARYAASFVLAAEEAPNGYPYIPRRQDRSFWSSLAGGEFEVMDMTLTAPKKTPAKRDKTPDTQPDSPAGQTKSKKIPRRKSKKQPAHNPARPKSGKASQSNKPDKPNNQVYHDKYGKGRIVKELTRGGQKWLQVKFANDTLEFRAKDPALRRVR